MSVRCATGLNDGLVADLVLAVGDVVAHRVVEQEGLLRDDPDLPPERSQADLAEVHVVNEDRPFRWIVKTGNEVHEGRLTGAAAPNKSQHLAGPDHQRNIAQGPGLDSV